MDLDYELQREAILLLGHASERRYAEFEDKTKLLMMAQQQLDRRRLLKKLGSTRQAEG